MADLYAAQVELERAVSSGATAEQIKRLHGDQTTRRAKVDELLMRHIALVGKMHWPLC